MSTFKHYLSALCLLLMGMGAAVSNAATDDNSMVFSENKVGVMTRDMTEAKLRTLLPAKDIKRIVYGSMMDGFECAIALFPGTDKEITTLWKSPEAEVWKELSQIGNKIYSGRASRAEALEEMQSVCDKAASFTNPTAVVIESGSGWATKEGVRTDIDMTALEAINTKPISFTPSVCGGECDEGMNIGSFNGGILDSMTWLSLSITTASNLAWMNGVKAYEKACGEKYPNPRSGKQTEEYYECIDPSYQVAVPAMSDDQKNKVIIYSMTIRW